jgi:four helix bundle protein
MKENIIKSKSFDFAIRIVKLYQFLCEQKKEFVLSKQLLRSGTSIGANVREAEHAESKSDFIHKISISLKEANESAYWIELIYKTDYIEKSHFISIQTDLDEILKLLITILKTSKSNKNKL